MKFTAINACLREARAVLLCDLELAPDAESRDQIMRDACIENGGTLVTPQTESSWGPVHVEISLLGVSANGADTDTAIAVWRRAAGRMEEAYQTEECAA